MRFIDVALAALLLVIAAPARAQDALAEARLAADLGQGAEAERLLESVAADASAPAAHRGEALVRLGALRRGRDDAAGAAEAFRGALAQAGDDESVLALLARTVEGVSADGAILRAGLGKATLREDQGRLRLELAGGDGGSACVTASAVLVTLSLQDGELADAAWLLAEAAGITVVLSPCLSSSDRSVSLDLREVPAGHALAALQRMQGLRCSMQGKVLIIGCADAPPLGETTCADISVEPVSIVMKGALGGDVIGLFGAMLGVPFLAQECVQARKVSMQLSDVPAGDVLCALARANGWTVERKDDGVHVRCVGDPGAIAAPRETLGKPLALTLATLAREANRDVVVSLAVRGRCDAPPPGEPGAALDALIAARELRTVDCGGVALILPKSAPDDAAAPAGVPADFPAVRCSGTGNRPSARDLARGLARDTGRLLIPGCRPADWGVEMWVTDAPAGALLDAWCRAQRLRLRASGPALFAWQPPCDGPKGEVLRASARDGRIDLAVEDLLAPHVAAALNLLVDETTYVDVRLRERSLSLDGTWTSKGDPARALAAALGTEATWSEAHDAWLVGPADAVLLGDGFRRYAVRAESMTLAAWLEVVTPFALWPVKVADGVDVTRSIPLSDLRANLGGSELIRLLEQRTPYRVEWDDEGLVIKP